MTKLTNEERRQLRKAERAVRQMAPRDRAIFLEHCLHDISYRELAARHAISVAEVEAALCRSLAIFADIMEAAPRPWWMFWRR